MRISELDDIEKEILMGKVVERARADLNQGRPLTEMRDSGVTHEMLFAPCLEGEHSDCIGYSNGLRRDGQMSICNCECHQHEGALPTDGE